MSFRVWLIVALLAGFQNCSTACIRFFEENPVPSPKSLTPLEALQQHEPLSVWEERAKTRQEVADKQWDYRSQNNLSAALAHIGKLDEALDRMQTVERVYPNQMETAYNMGTVYELKNDLPKALYWIKEGIKRELKTSGRSRLSNTEWLHVRILDAKINLQRDPAYLQSYAVSGLDFGTARMPQMPDNYPTDGGGSPSTLAEGQKALQEQLHERLEFVKAPDPIVGDLLFDYANSLAVTGNEDAALDVYRLALDFVPLRSTLVQKRFDYFAGTPNYTLIGAMWALAFGAIGWYYGCKKWREMQEWKALPVKQLDDLGPARRTAYIDCSRYDPTDRS